MTSLPYSLCVLHDLTPVLSSTVYSMTSPFLGPGRGSPDRTLIRMISRPWVLRWKSGFSKDLPGSWKAPIDIYSIEHSCFPTINQWTTKMFMIFCLRMFSYYVHVKKLICYECKKIKKLYVLVSNRQFCKERGDLQSLFQCFIDVFNSVLYASFHTISSLCMQNNNWWILFTVYVF